MVSGCQVVFLSNENELREIRSTSYGMTLSFTHKNWQMRSLALSCIPKHFLPYAL